MWVETPRRRPLGPEDYRDNNAKSRNNREIMSRRDSSKYKINRRLGVNLWGRQKSPLNRNRDYGPGQHGQRRKKPSDYGVQLMAKQKLKGYYGNIGERQFRRLYQEALRRKYETGEALIELLERRLDAVIYRMKFAPTVFSARQLVNHGHVRVNGKRVNIPSFQVSDNDAIELKDKAKQMALVMESVKSAERDVPDYVEVDHDRMKGRFIRAPKLADVPYPVPMEPNLVVEFYSR
jgi:small subunit ribosomal protein S4